MNKTGPLVIGGVICLILAVFWPSDGSQPTPQNQTSSSGEAVSGQQAEAPSGYRKVETRELDVGTHVIQLQKNVKSETFTFARGVKGFRYDFSTSTCREIYGNSNPSVRNCGSDRVKLSKPGESVNVLAFKPDDDMDVVITVR